ncbi:cysteine desulfurase family protein [Gaetbulibacter sp. M240]|uniref:cysteine desulfurase family protein n=1 Tax=Gaetbulibacter sp. M240 TaxID=3126511 RepID=UPI00374E79EF
MRQVYFDNAATTQMRDKVVEAMTEVLKNNFGNPSSTHSFGRHSKALIEQSRKTVAKCLNCSASEIIFTSGGTEADNLVLRSAVRDLGVKHIISSKIEHHAVLHTLDQLAEEYDLTISYVNLDPHGDIDYLHLETLLQTDKPTLVSLMHVNNEIGTILDLKKVAELCKTFSAFLHSDAVQSIGHYPLDLQETPVDFLAASAHKFHGPKGVGFAFVRKNTGLKPLIFGGEQERGLRAGTECTHNIVGLASALELSSNNFETEYQSVKELKAYFIRSLKDALPEVKFNGYSGDLEKSTYTLVNVCLPVSAQKGGMLLFQLDLKGIACSKGSACQSGSNQNSHVLNEILNDAELQKPSVRFSFSIFNSKAEVDYVVSVLKENILSQVS